MFDILRSGGLLMIPIGLCAVSATFIIFERLYYFFSIKKRDTPLASEVSRLIAAHRYEDAVSYCVNADTPAARVVKKAVECRTWPEDHIREAVSVETDTVIPELEHFLTPLGTIANISTLLGLLGTVTGNIQAFGLLGAGGSMGDPASLAGAIAEALVTTAAGLVVSIPSVIFHNYFISRVNRRITDIEAASTGVILQLCGRTFPKEP